MKVFNIMMSCLIVISTFFTSAIPTLAYSSINDEKLAAGRWSEQAVENVEAYSTASVQYEPTWVLRNAQTVSVTPGSIVLNSYTMEYLNGTKSCKGVTSHSAEFLGYVRARFENVWGDVIAGSDSGRILSYYGAVAVTPDEPHYVGWNGFAHTYCGASN